MDCSTPGFPVHHHLPEFSQTDVNWIDDVIQPCHFLSSLLLLPSLSPSFRAFSNKSGFRIRRPNYWTFSISISPCNEYSELLDFFAVQGTLKSKLQHHSIKASILWFSAIFMGQLSRLYMTTGKIITLTRWTLLAR